MILRSDRNNLPGRSVCPDKKEIGEGIMSFVDYAVEGAVGTITINRPQALNALNSAVLDDLNTVLDNVDLDTVRCLVLTGAGEKSFVAGADIGEMSTLTKAEGEAFGKKGNDVFLKIESFPIPVIAAVNGFALGGGNELAMSCDIRLCSDNAVFGQPETGLGITPGFGGTQRLARLVGMGMAKQMVYAAANIKADEAYRIGLVNAVYPQEELLPAAQKLERQKLPSTRDIRSPSTAASVSRKRSSAAASRQRIRRKAWQTSSGRRMIRRRSSTSRSRISNLRPNGSMWFLRLF